MGFDDSQLAEITGQGGLRNGKPMSFKDFLEFILVLDNLLGDDGLDGFKSGTLHSSEFLCKQLLQKYGKYAGIQTFFKENEKICYFSNRAFA